MDILFLEDEPTIQEVLTEYMRIQGYEVTCVQDGEEALGMRKVRSFDMAVLDIMVPGVSGLEVLRYIKEERPEMATIMLTALGDEKTQVQAFNLYADDYVIKPVSPIILLKRMEMKLLLYLVRNRNRLVEKEELFKEVWQEAYVGDGTLNVHIRKLREKVEENPSSPVYIITEYGKGYMFRLAKEN